jgi:hypothetical protein
MQQRQKPTPNLNYNLNERNHTRYYKIMRAGNTHPQRTGCVLTSSNSMVDEV